MKKIYYFFLVAILFGNVAIAHTPRFFSFEDTDEQTYDECFNADQIAPGLNGTLHFSNYMQTPDAAMIIDIDDEGNKGEILVSEIAMLDGTLKINFVDGDYKNVELYRIVHADIGVGGLFKQVIFSHIGLGQLIYDAEDVTLKFIHLDALELEGNASKAAESFLTSSITDPDVAIVNETLFTLDNENLQNAFNQLQPSNYNALSEVQFTNAVLLRSSITRHLQCARKNECGRFNFWGDTNNQWQNQQNHCGQRGYEAFTTLASLGFDYTQNNIVLGAIGSYSYTDLDWHRGSGHAHINSYYGGFYGLWQQQCYFLDFAALGAYNKYHTERNFCFGKLFRHLDEKHSGSEVLLEIGGGKQGCFHNYLWTAFGRFDYVMLCHNGFHEHGAKCLNLNVDKKRDHFLQSELGGVLYRNFDWQCGIWTPQLKLSYINQSSLNQNCVKSKFKKSARDFCVKHSFTRNLFAPGLQLTYLSLCENVCITLDYDAQIGSDYWSQAADLQVNFQF